MFGKIKKRLLLVEDEVLISMMIREELENYDYEVTTVNTGEKAVDYIFSHDDIDLILMDINLGSGIDGTEAARRIFSRKNLPLIFHSSHTEPEIVKKTEEITNYGYVVKNSGITVLDASIKMAFKLFEARIIENKKEKALQESKALLNETGDIARVGGWRYTPENNKLIWTDAACKIYEVSTEYKPALDEALNYYHQDYQKTIKEAVSNAINNGSSFDIEAKLLTAEGRQKWVRTIGNPIIENDKITAISGTIQDITEQKNLKKGREAFIHLASLKNADTKKLCDHILESILDITNSEYGFYGFLNEDESIMTIHSWSGIAMKDCNMIDKPTEFAISDSGVWAEAVRNRKPFVMNDYSDEHPQKKGMPRGHVAIKTMLVIPVISEDKITAIAAVANRLASYSSNDISELNAFFNSIQALTDSKRAEYLLNEKVNFTKKLLVASKMILNTDGFEETARNIFDACRDLTGASSGYVALLSEDGSENEVLFLESGGLPCSVDENLPMPIRGLREQAYRTGRAVYNNDFMNSEWIQYMPPGHVILKNVMFAPLNIEGKTVGLMGLANKPSAFSIKDTEIAEAFGDLAAIALNNSIHKKQISDLSLFQEENTNPVFRVSKDMKLLYTNQAGSKLLSSESLSVGNTVSDIWHTSIEEAWEREGVIQKEIKLGDRIYNFTGIPIKEENYINVYAVDITEQKRAERNSAQYEELFLQVFEQSAISSCLYNPTGTIIKVNEEFCNMFGVQQSIITDGRYNVFKDESIKDAEIFNKIEDVFKNKQPHTWELNFDIEAVSKTFGIPTEKPEKIYIEVFGYPVLDKNEELKYVVLQHFDITDRKKTERALKDHKEKLSMILESFLDPVYLVSPDYRITFANQAMKELYGEFTVGKICYESTYKRSTPCDWCVFPKLNTENRVERYEHFFKRENKCRIITNILLDDNSKLTIYFDITDQKEAEKIIQKQLKEKEILLREVHHRIKNNMANIESLLFLQVSSSSNPEVRTALQKATSRVSSMRILYDKLLISEDYKEISLKKYLDIIIDSLIEVYDLNTNITIETNIVDFNIDSKNAITIGIIINELITNAIKYAFKDYNTGIVSISVAQYEEEVTLMVQDNGIGIDSSILENGQGGFGLNIIKMLVEQLSGSVCVENDSGTKTIIQFEI